MNEPNNHDQLLAEVYRDIEPYIPTDDELDELARLDSMRHGTPHEL